MEYVGGNKPNQNPLGCRSLMSLRALVKGIGSGSGNITSLMLLNQGVEEGQETCTWRRRCADLFFLSLRI